MVLPFFDCKKIKLSIVSRLRINGQPAAQLVYSFLEDCSQFSLVVMHAPQITMAEREEGYALVVGDDSVCCCKKPHNGYSILCRMIDETYLCMVVESEDPGSFYMEHLKDGFDKSISWMNKRKE